MLRKLEAGKPPYATGRSPYWVSAAMGGSVKEFLRFPSDLSPMTRSSLLGATAHREHKYGREKP